MISSDQFYHLLQKSNITFFCGVPDSLLQDFLAYLTDHTDAQHHIISANEGGAIALAAGYYLATGNVGLVYLQNSGQGNALNPLTSLTDPEIYSIPLLLLIGWRGEPTIHDEPQHRKQGRITLQLLDLLGIPYEVLPDTLPAAEQSITKACHYMLENRAPYALIVRRGVFAPYQSKEMGRNIYSLTREEALRTILESIDQRDLIVATTGITSRELFAHRERNHQPHHKDFLTVGSMGHASQIALGIAIVKPQHCVYCLDGDGALIMHMGSLAIIGAQHPPNFKHIVLNNGVHDSVGGQPTVGFILDIPAAARASGYKAAYRATTLLELQEKFSLLKAAEGPALLEVRIAQGFKKSLGRPTIPPRENKNSFMQFLAALK